MAAWQHPTGSSGVCQQVVAHQGQTLLLIKETVKHSLY
jgi:hypothetical protein